MKFQVLSHAGLAVYAAQTTLVCDPWLVGSCYWRSWWNYPPVPSTLANSLCPDFIYLTHIHWDHFHGPSLRRFSKDTQLLVPKASDDRMRRDLTAMGFRNVRELKHGRSLDLAPDLSVTSYHFGVFLDSALIVECDGVVLLNANDAKFMGGPLHQILRRHPRIDFVLRSHSSANSRACFDVVEKPAEQSDDNPLEASLQFDREVALNARVFDAMDDPGIGRGQVSAYVREFALFAQATEARYAVPFASNQCHLHKEVYNFNPYIQTPSTVADYFRAQGITSPHLQVMVAGDAWSSERGFELTDEDFFLDRDARLAAYQERKQDVLESFYRREERAVVRLSDMQEYFGGFSNAIPRFVRRSFRGHPLVYVLHAGARRFVFEVDLYARAVRELTAVPTDAQIVITTSAFIMRQCLKLNLFTHLAVSRRVRYRVTSRSKRYVQRLNLLFNMYEYDWLPLHRALRPRVFQAYRLRWREVVLYLQFGRDWLLTRRVNPEKYIDRGNAGSVGPCPVTSRGTVSAKKGQEAGD